MPNWIESFVIIVARKEILDEIEEKKLSFNYFVPRPESEEENWYNWNNENWGTKWDIVVDGEHSEDLIFDRQGDDRLSIIFRTAWNTPYKFFKKFIDRYEKMYIEVKYEDIDDVAKGVYILSKHGGKIYEKGICWNDPRGEISIEDFNNEEENEVKKPINITI